eukprot:02346.XXX_3111_3529_1 [CDS] Oithona nana genome sequencing.
MASSYFLLLLEPPPYSGIYCSTQSENCRLHMNNKTDNGNEQITSAHSKLQELERLVDQKSN